MAASWRLGLGAGSIPSSPGGAHISFVSSLPATPRKDYNSRGTVKGASVLSFCVVNIPDIEV